MMMPWKKRKLIRQLTGSFGKDPEKDYYAGDMDWIRTYFDLCRAEGRDSFYLDETTWKDLDLDRVYRQMNACQSTAGEQYLYYMLRRPMDRETFEDTKGLIRLQEERPDIRLKIQLLLNGLGYERALDLTSVFHPKGGSPFWLTVYILMNLALFLSVLAIPVFGLRFVFIPVVLLAFNTFFHEYRRIRCEGEIRRVNYCVALALSLNRMRKWKIPELDRYLSGGYAHLDRMKPILRSGPVMSGLNSDPFQAAVLNMSEMDLIAFEILKRRLAKYHEHFLAVHEAVGRVDAAIAVASWRAGQAARCVPEIDFGAEQPYIRAEGIRHPMLKDPVPNGLTLDRSLLITGSNASGKSTYLRSAMLCALTAQTVCTCSCASYTGTPFRIYTSIDLSDDLLAGESYYIAEIRSIKRILDEQRKDGFVLCALDEVLRGTNTIERIAASAEILKALDRPGTLCLIATHDAELCALCGEGYRLAHFEETVSDTEIRFDYRLKDGPAETRNAIHLLKLMGFDDGIVSAAHRRADEYVKTGKWT